MTRVENSLSALAAKEAVQSALFRLAYNQYDRFLALQERPRQVGVFHQSFAQSENAAAAGFTQLKNGVWLMKNTTAMTLEDIRPSLRQLTSLSSSSDTVTLTFTTTAAGMLTQVRLTGQFYGGSAESFNSGKMFLRLWNTGTGELEQSDTVILNGLNGDNAAGTFFIDKMDLPLHGGQSYRLELQLETLNFHPAIGANVNGNCMSISGALSAGTDSVSHRFQEPFTSSGGLIVARYESFGTGNALTLKWENQPFTPTVTRTLDGKIQEAQFQVTRFIPADSTAALHLRCGTGGDILLHSWGGVLIG